MGAARLRGSWPASDYTEADHEHALGGMHALLREGEGLIGHGAVVMRRPVHNGQCAAHRLCRGRRGPRRPAPPRGTATSSWRRWSASSAGATCWAPSARADEEGGTYVPPGQRTAGCRRRSRLRLARRRTVVTSASSVQPRHGQRPTRRHAFAPGSRRANGRWRARLAIRILCVTWPRSSTRRTARCAAAVRANWQATQFDRDSRRHVSTYERETVV